MSSYFDDASLVMIPSGYKTSKVYSVKPTSGDGDLTFTRSNDTATRVGPDGLIEKVRTNLYTHSQTFANAAWLTLNVTKVSTSATDPNGGTTAANITWTAGSDRFFYQSKSTSSISTVSFYVKSNGGGNNFRFFANGAAILSSDLTATSTWTRYSFSFTGNGSVGVGITNASDNSAADLLVAFAQLETGDIATDYIATTTAAVSVGPVANVPRLDYLGSSCPRLLLEPQRTNLLTYSEQLDNAIWTKSGSGTGSAAVVTANYGISPDGYANADRVQLNKGAGTSSSDFSLIQQAITSVTTGTSSIWMKSADGNNYTVALRSVSFNLCQVTSEWQRFTYTESNMALLQLILRGTYGTSNTADILVWGGQIEEGAYASSYIPTLGAAVTRGEDDASKTGISSLIGQTEGTVFFAADMQQADAGWGEVMRLQGATAGDSIALYFNPAGQFYFEVAVGGVAQVSSYLSTNGGNLKMAIAYKANDYKIYVNGAAEFTQTSGSVPTCDKFYLLNGPFAATKQGRVSQTLLFPTRLSNADLAALTA